MLKKDTLIAIAALIVLSVAMFLITSSDNTVSADYSCDLNVVNGGGGFCEVCTNTWGGGLYSDVSSYCCGSDGSVSSCSSWDDGFGGNDYACQQFGPGTCDPHVY